MPSQTQELKKGQELTVNPAYWDPTHMHVYICMHVHVHAYAHRENLSRHGSPFGFWVTTCSQALVLGKTAALSTGMRLLKQLQPPPGSVPSRFLIPGRKVK